MLLVLSSRSDAKGAGPATANFGDEGTFFQFWHGQGADLKSGRGEWVFASILGFAGALLMLDLWHAPIADISFTS